MHLFVYSHSFSNHSFTQSCMYSFNHSLLHVCFDTDYLLSLYEAQCIVMSHCVQYGSCSFTRSCMLVLMKRCCMHVPLICMTGAARPDCGAYTAENHLLCKSACPVYSSAYILETNQDLHCCRVGRMGKGRRCRRSPSALGPEVSSWDETGQLLSASSPLQQLS